MYYLTVRVHETRNYEVGLPEIRPTVLVKLETRPNWKSLATRQSTNIYIYIYIYIYIFIQNPRLVLRVHSGRLTAIVLSKVL